MISPPGTILQRPVQQPPPEKAAVRIPVDYRRPPIIRLENRPRAHRPARQNHRIRDIRPRLVPTATGGDHRAGPCHIRAHRRRRACGCSWGGGRSSLRIFKSRKILSAGFLLPRSCAAESNLKLDDGGLCVAGLAGRADPLSAAKVWPAPEE